MIAEATTYSSQGVSLRTIAQHSTETQVLDRVSLRFALQAGARALLPRERVSTCLRAVIPTRSVVEVYSAPHLQTASLGGLSVCSSVWLCPVCAAKISERRRVEMQGGLETWFAAGGYVLMATFTLQHSSSDALGLLLSSLQKAYRRLVAGRWYQDFKKEYEIAGTIKALEVTHGASGWHPHLHVLFFVRCSPVYHLLFAESLKARWLHNLHGVGASASWQYGCDVRLANDEAATYVAKWGKEQKWSIAHEMSKAVVKRARGRAGASPMELLARYTLEADNAAGRLWLAYASAFKAQHQLRYSPGLRALLGLVVDKSDQELAEEHDEGSVLLALLRVDQWRWVVGNDMRADVLSLAAAGDGDVFWSTLLNAGMPV